MANYMTDLDMYLFGQGTHYELYEKMGAHHIEKDGVWGVQFDVWAPSARNVSLLTGGNGWTKFQDNFTKINDSIWELFVPGMNVGESYKFHIVKCDGSEVEKADPYSFGMELRPRTASIVTDYHAFQWNDEEWRKKKASENYLEEPMSIYEIHLGSWKKDLNKWDQDKFLDYRTLAHEVTEYVKFMGYTHVEVMGICEYPFDPSWGYQVVGYYAPTARYGSPYDFAYFVNYLHENGIGVILDWVPAHFPKDEFGLSEFDGTLLYEYSDPLRAEYKEWGTKAFDLGKKEVSNFLIASALYWINVYHLDALRVDAVAAMLYNSFGRAEWRPNIYGGNLNLESFEFFKHLNSILRTRTNAFLIAEDSSTIEGITRNVQDGGLGFGLKWDMGWMNDTLRYVQKDPIYKKYDHYLMTHTLDYVFDEHFCLVLSHDEVVYGKGSMYGKMPGDDLAKLGCLKTYYTMMFGHPGKKLLFMGQDFAQIREWDYKSSLDWHLADVESHRDIMNHVQALLHIYKNYPVLYNDNGNQSFEWIDGGDAERSIFTFIRRNPWNYNNALVFVCNFTPVQRDFYAVGVPHAGKYKRIYTTYPDTNEVVIEAERRVCNGREYCLPFDLRAYESVIFEVPMEEVFSPKVNEVKTEPKAKVTSKVKEETPKKKVSKTKAEPKTKKVVAKPKVEAKSKKEVKKVVAKKASATPKKVASKKTSGKEVKVPPFKKEVSKKSK